MSDENYLNAKRLGREVERYREMQMRALLAPANETEYVPNFAAQRKAAFWRGFRKGWIDGSVIACKVIAVGTIVFFTVKFFII